MIVPSSYLRIYQPLESFDAPERDRWVQYIESGQQPPKFGNYREVAFEESSAIGVLHPPTSDHAHIKRVRSRVYVCPLKTRLRVLVGLLDYRDSLPSHVVDSFVPEEEAAKAVAELEKLGGSDSGLISNIKTSAWHVPLSWFVAFEDGERVVADQDNSKSITYQTDLQSAIARVERAISIMREAGLADEVIEMAEQLLTWMREFPSSSLLELDYGSVAPLFSDEDLVLDRSAGEVWSSLEALEANDFEESGRIYAELISWWGRVRSLESAN